MIAALTFLESPIGKLIGYAAGAVAVLALAMILLAAHDQKIRNTDNLAVERKTDQALVDAANRAMLEALRERDAAIAAANQAAAIKRDISRAPVSTTCLDSAAVRALLDGLQPDRPGSSNAPRPR